LPGWLGTVILPISTSCIAWVNRQHCYAQLLVEMGILWNICPTGLELQSSLSQPHKYLGLWHEPLEPSILDPFQGKVRWPGFQSLALLNVALELMTLL
jgi:hypothetical protein